MNCAKCDGCENFFANLDPGDRSYPIHRIVVDSVRENSLCDRCLDAFDLWLRGRSKVKEKWYRASIWVAITRRFRRWLTRLVVTQVPGGQIVMVAPRKAKPDDDEEKIESPFSQTTPPV